MRVWIVVEGKTDALIVRTLLPEEMKKIGTIVIGGGRSNLSSVARTLLVKHREPTAVLADGDSLDASSIREKFLTMQQLLQAVSGGIPFKVILCIPTLEAVFCDNMDILGRIFPNAGVDSYLMQCKTQPKEALAHFFQHGGGPGDLVQLLNSLTSEDIERLRSTHPVSELITFISEAILDYISKQ